MEPGRPGSGFVFKNALKGDEIPSEFVKDAEAGLVDAMQAGVLAGYKMDDVTVSLVGGSYNELTSVSMAYRIAANIAFKDGARKALRRSWSRS